MRRSLILGLVPTLPLALLFSACQARPVNLGLGLSFPQGLLDQATSVTLSVFDASLATCTAGTGYVSAIPASAQVFPLQNTGCTGGSVWCATIELDRDGSTKMFAVVAAEASATIAEGCTTAVIDQDPLQVDIQAYRYSPPKCCNDGKLEAGEQCDTGVPGTCVASTPVGVCSGIVDNPVCYCDCTAKEILLSVDDPTAPHLANGPAGSKGSLAISFGPGGVSNPEMLRAVYADDDPKSTTGIDLHESFLAADLYPIKNPLPLSLQLELPVLCSAVTNATGTALDQVSPAIATAANDTVVVVYQSNQDNIGNNWDVFLNPQIPDGCTNGNPCTASADCQTSCDPTAKTCTPIVKLDTMGVGATDPHVAGGPAGAVLVTWTRTDGVYGRIWRTDGTLVPAAGEIPIAPSGSAARVAGDVNGFWVVYQGQGTGDTDGIFMRSVEPSKGAVGAEVAVNTVTAGLQDQPNIAMLDDGSTLVVWHSGGDIFFQRFDGMGNKSSPDDQTLPLNTTGAADGTNQQHPAVTGANGYFVVAWETPGAVTATGTLGNIAARFVGSKTGFGYNSVSGQNDDFIATDLGTTGDRYLPAVAMSTYTAIGWEDHSTTHGGVWVRRFPAPAN